MKDEVENVRRLGYFFVSQSQSMRIAYNEKSPTRPNAASS